MRGSSPKALGIDPANVIPGSPEAIYCEAYKAAETAVTYAFVEFGGEPNYCGFSWVKIRPARGPFVAFCKRHKLGDNGAYGGWEFSLDVYRGQSMDIKDAGTRAFSEVLRSYGIKASTITRAD